MKQAPFDVFVSYSNDDRHYAEELLAALSESGLASWNDESLMAGSDWAVEIETALRNAEVVVLLVSPSSLSSEWVNFELGLAIAAGKRLIPVLIRDVSYMPSNLSRIQYIDARKLRPAEVGRKLAEMVQSSDG